jgi:acetoin:2,6-dichlorophenolindophenol oxidoreductase subunit beta
MQQLGMGQAVNQALREEMTRDPDVFHRRRRVSA